jgi:hypothetical protein
MPQHKRPPRTHEDFPEGAAEGTRTITVLKPFIFSSPGADRGDANLVNLIPKERKFEIGEHDVTEEVYLNPYIYRDYADGHIESPEQAIARHRAIIEKSERDKLEAHEQLERANAALARSRPIIGMTDALQKELNTPVSVLRAQNAGARVNKGPGEGVTSNGLPHDPEKIETVGKLRTDGPTLDEYVSAGYSAETYPPRGYEARVGDPDISNTAGTAAALSADGSPDSRADSVPSSSPPPGLEGEKGTQEVTGSADLGLPPPPPPLEPSDNAPVAKDMAERAKSGKGNKGK